MKRRICLIISALLIVLSVLTGCSQTFYGDEYSFSEENSEIIEVGLEEDSSEIYEDEEEFTSEEGEDVFSEEELTSEDNTVDGQDESEVISEETSDAMDENASYTSKEDVALYIHTYGHLPGNFITKKEAQKKGWDSKEGNLWDVAPGCSIGGDYFGNYEGLLPEKNGREYHECDIDFNGGYRDAKRIIYSNDGLIYYTEDHYKSFTLLYGEED